MNKDLKILVTGGGGFIGSSLVDRLKVMGLTVDSVSRSVPIGASMDGKFHHVDLAEEKAAFRLLEEVSPDIIIHLAARTFPEEPADQKLRSLFLRDNLYSTINILEYMRRSGRVKLVHIGTCGEYGNNPSPLREDLPPSPISFYSLTKAMATMAALFYAKVYSLQVIVLRPFLTYGPNQRDTGRFIPSAIIHALKRREFKMTDGTMTRDFNYVSDIVTGIIGAVQKDIPAGEVINLCTGNAIPLREVAEMIFELCGAPASLIKFGALAPRRGETSAFFGSTEKARRLLGYAPSVPLEEGLRETIRWYRKNIDIQD